ncbi:surface lipoprotein assembly modifier [Devosia nitrariae]|uniref:DUF560 domain-containing protein n=1 Tax=Devosia nitrariae TaxID=2071872 RepID=A0ABQ5W1T6_9HYPH|nr:surface lipoprotein assembly modifier [Devosia nitrariae]GLQ53774.1 hypothetical protein GCM10010862_10330 [Devosia nitrariae]
MTRFAYTLAVAALLSLFPPSFPVAGEAEAAGPALAHLVAQGDFEEARRLLRAGLEGQPAAPLHLAQLEGIIRQRQGRTSEAIDIFRAILSAAPDFTPARMELARALRVSGDTEAAYHHFEILSRAGDHPVLRQMAATAMSAIAADRPYGFSGHVALLPSTNVNKGSGRTTFTAGGLEFVIDDDSRAASGIGLAVGGDAFGRLQLGNAHALTAALGLDIRKYENADFDEASLEGELMLSHETAAFRLDLGPTGAFHWQGWEPYLVQYGVAARFAAPLSPRDLVTLSFEALAQDYVDLDYRDGWRLTTAASFQHAVSPSLSVWVSLGGTLERTEREHLDHSDVVAGLGVSKEWAGGLITTLFGSYEYHGYLGNYPATSAPRRDDKVALGVTLSHRAINLGGFTPQASYQYSRQFSNVGFFDYDSHDLNLGLSKKF